MQKKRNILLFLFVNEIDILILGVNASEERGLNPFFLYFSHIHDLKLKTKCTKVDNFVALVVCSEQLKYVESIRGTFPL